MDLAKMSESAKGFYLMNSLGQRWHIVIEAGFILRAVSDKNLLSDARGRNVAELMKGIEEIEEETIIRLLNWRGQEVYIIKDAW